jgi:glutathione S-transferase
VTSTVILALNLIKSYSAFRSARGALQTRLPQALAVQAPSRYWISVSSRRKVWSMIKVWGRRSSSNVQSVMWSIAELGLPYERYDFGHRYGGVDTPEFLAMNPNGTVPVVRDGDGEPLWESSAILRYLANRYGRAPYWPDDLTTRTQIDKWAEWSKINVGLNFIRPVFWQVVRTPPSRRDANALKQALQVLDRYLDIAERQLAKGAFLCGDDLTPADVQLGHLLFRYFDIDIARPERPRLSAYYKRLVDRPAYREHVMISYDELRPTEA